MENRSDRRAAAPRVVAVIPAAGQATRLAPLPCSKELLPIGLHREPGQRRGRPKVVSHYLIEKMVAAGARQILFVLRSGKWDIAAYYGDGAAVGAPIAYVVAGETWGPAFTVACAAPFVADATVLFGFPDILIGPDDAYARLLARLDTSGADLVLGTFRGALRDGLDLVTTDACGRVLRLVTKEENPPRAEGDIGYMIAAWRPSFTAFLCEHTATLAGDVRGRTPAPDWPMGATIAAAIAAGLHVDSVFLPDARFLDVGTPQGLAEAGEFPGVWWGRP